MKQLLIHVEPIYMIKSCKFNTYLFKKTRQNKEQIKKMIFCNALFLTLSVSHFSFSFPNFCVPCWVTGNTNCQKYADEAELVHIHEAVVLTRDSITGPHYTEPVTLRLSEIERERDRGSMYSASHFFIFNLHFNSPDHSSFPLLIRPIPVALMIFHN